MEHEIMLSYNPLAYTQISGVQYTVILNKIK